MNKIQFSDYGQIHTYLFDKLVDKVYQPELESDIGTISKVVATSSKLTISGGAHTFNGSSLPSRDALHLDFSRFRWLKTIDSSTIEVAAGVTMWDLRDYLLKYSLHLKVWNGGFAGPTLGGYINAGGFGRSGLSEKDGGFWEIVEYLRICVPSTGEILVVDKNQDLFKWLFGSAGSLAIIISAGISISGAHCSTLKNLSTSCVPHLQNILYHRHRLPALFKYLPFTQQESDFLDHDKRLFWFSLLAYPEQHHLSLSVLSQFCQEFPEYIVPFGGWLELPDLSSPLPAYHYIIEHKTFIPPLLMDSDRTFFVNGVMSYLPVNTIADHSLLRKASSFFTDLAVDSGLRLYHQAEDFFSLLSFPSYYDSKTWRTYQDLKLTLDPIQKLRSFL